MAPIQITCKDAQTLYSEKFQLNKLEPAPQYNILGSTGNSVNLLKITDLKQPLGKESVKDKKDFLENKNN